METNFQTSFIPKKPLIPQINVRTKSGASIFIILAVFIFIISVVGAGFTFVAKSILLKNQEQDKIDLADNEKRFNLALIEELKKANIKIDLAKELLKNHIVVSEVFNMIGGLTIDGVRFNSFDFSAPDILNQAGKPFKINMKGVANNFSSVAFQSDVFGRSQKYGTNKVIKNPVLSDLQVDANGNVGFNFSAEIVGTDILYEKILENNLRMEGILPSEDASTQLERENL
ncbi:MAG TPA: hypothetical protein VJJ28_02125 [Candidatus Paceibacterota bacterium]